MNQSAAVSVHSLWPDAYHEVIQAVGRVAQAMISFRTFLGENPGAPGLAYLANMAPRLVELRRLLKPIGSIYMHCDQACFQQATEIRCKPVR